jgi:hypothetical protein
MTMDPMEKSWKQVFFVYSKSEYTLESVSVSVRPSVYTITFERIVRLSWNFLHSIIPWISRSSSKMGMIRQGFTDFQQELPLFSIVLMEILTHSNFRKP